MLGMMNCPTDSVEFYSASPSMKRSMEESASTMEKLAGMRLADASATQSTSCADSPASAPPTAAMRRAADSLSSSDSDSDVVRVFSEAREKPHFVYTSDGRKLVGKMDGKSNSKTAMRDPIQLWNRLILGSVVTSRMEERRRRYSSDIAQPEVEYLEKKVGRSESVYVVAPTVVNAANPAAGGSQTAAPNPSLSGMAK